MKTVTVITGGAGGMGFATASIFGHQGHTLLLCDVKEESLESAAAALRRQNMDVHYLVTDVTDRAQVDAAAKKAAELGTVKNVIHTAGLSPVLVEKLGPEEGRKAIVKVNALGTVYMTEAFYPVLSEGGSMVLFTSSAAYLMPVVPESMQKIFFSIKDEPEQFYERMLSIASDPGRAYMFSKLFNMFYVRMNAGRFGHKGCRINSIAPGRIVTPMHQTLIDREPERIAGELATMPLGRYGAAYEIGNLIDFLCSYRASYINGIDILMDEGTQAFTSTPQLPD